MSGPTDATSPTMPSSSKMTPNKLPVGTRVWLKENLESDSPESSQSTDLHIGSELKIYVILQNNGAFGLDYRIARENDTDGPDWWYGRKDLERVPGGLSKGQPSTQMSPQQATWGGASGTTTQSQASVGLSTVQATGKSASKGRDETRSLP
ncbi:hypothetical protein N7G274_007067 [Stereocaulon virgatum]|uniref:Uncharacterized protein n=1 Tax=Stereocaulon virgatum TaxID=373712 RepID=A0ABR4A3T1_9LECA